MKYTWYKFISQFLAAMSMKNPLTRIHVITSFWELSEDAEDLHFNRMDG